MSIGTRLKSILDVFSTIAVICAAGALLWTIFLQRPAAPAPLRQIEHVTGLWIDAEQITNVSGTGGIAIVEFSDFQCPFCGRYAREILPTIKKEFVASGRVKYVALHYPLEAIHPLALQASEAAECAGRQGQFWEMHEKLFAESVALADHGLLDYADALGLDRGMRPGSCGNCPDGVTAC